jgi:ketosteroid isomerase-like protein
MNREAADRPDDPLDDALSEADRRGIAEIRRQLDVEFGPLEADPLPHELDDVPAPPPGVRDWSVGRRTFERAAPRWWRRESDLTVDRSARGLDLPAPRPRAERTAIFVVMLIITGFIGFVSAVITVIMLEPSTAAVADSRELRPPSSLAAPSPSMPSTGTPPAGPASASSAPPRQPSAAAADLQSALARWIEATRRGDIDAQMAFYPAKLDVFYSRRNMSRAAVRKEKERVFADATTVDIVTGPPDITTQPDHRTAVTRFTKRYVIEGPRVRRRGEVVQELRWRRTPDGWKISAERDVEVVSRR